MTDPRRIIGADPRRYTLDGEDAARLESIAARTGGIVESEATRAGLVLRHIAATGRVREVTGTDAADAVRRLAAALGDG